MPQVCMSNCVCVSLSLCVSTHQWKGEGGLLAVVLATTSHHVAYIGTSDRCGIVIPAGRGALRSALAWCDAMPAMH